MRLRCEGDGRKGVLLLLKEKRKGEIFPPIISLSHPTIFLYLTLIFLFNRIITYLPMLFRLIVSFLLKRGFDIVDYKFIDFSKGKIKRYTISRHMLIFCHTEMIASYGLLLYYKPDTPLIFN